MHLMLCNYSSAGGTHRQAGYQVSDIASCFVALYRGTRYFMTIYIREGGATYGEITGIERTRTDHQSRL